MPTESKSELLAPAGGPLAFDAALKYGADAIYLGLSAFSARDKAENFTAENVALYIQKAHQKGVRVYIALNTIIADREMKSFLGQAKAAYLAGADAFIIQQLRLAPLLKKVFPDIELHLSTQGGTCNKEGALLAKEYQIDRVILARESNIEDIGQIAQIIDTEVFVQGALCASFSGQCLFSSVAGEDSSGNRGQCKQPCRKLYSLNGSAARYALSPCDLCLKDRLFELKEAGVKSFKIEGRLRSAHYVAAAVNFYAKSLKQKESAKDYELLKRNFYRGYTQGLSFSSQKDFLSSLNAHRGQSVGKVKSVAANYLTLTGKEVFQSGSGFKIFSKGEEVASAVASNGKIFFKGKVKIGDEVFITKDASSLTIEPLRIERQSIVKELPKESYEEIAFSEVFNKSAAPSQVLKEKRLVALISDDFKGFTHYDIAIFCPQDYFCENEYQRFFEQTADKEKYLYLPAYASSKDLEELKEKSLQFDGIYCQGYYGQRYAKELNINFFAGTGNNIYNSFDLYSLKGKSKYAAISLESSLIQAKSMLEVNKNAFLTILGAFEVMQLLFCPFGKNCANCGEKYLSVLKDEKSREFVLRKYLLGDCRFSLFNCAPLLCKWEGNALINALTLDKESVQKYLQSGLNFEKGQELFPRYTSFHRTKPLAQLGKNPALNDNK